MADSGKVKILAKNRKARFQYSVEDTIECGIALKGTEVKSMREAKFSFTDAFAEIRDTSVILQNLHINLYKFGNINNHDPDRKRRLLLHKDQIKRLKRKVDEKGYTLVPLSFLLKNGLVKVELGVCKGKKMYDKREDIKTRDLQRETQREFKHNLR